MLLCYTLDMLKRRMQFKGTVESRQDGQPGGFVVQLLSKSGVETVTLTCSGYHSILIGQE